MKKLLLILTTIICLSTSGYCEDFDYQKTYRDLEPANFSYIHNVDPDQYYENQGYTWSPYPLFRLNSYLYFKNVSIEPGYYNLTPRDHKGKTYILFKESGLVRYIIPVYKKDFVPEYFYEENLPQPKLTFGQKCSNNMMNFIGRWVPSAKRKPMPQSYLEVTDLDHNFVSIVIYYKEFRYYTIFRTVKL